VLQNILNIKSKESAVINSNNGSHLSGKNNTDVTGFYSSDGSRVIKYIPRNLENIFTNLKMILINYGRLKEIQQSDLRPFSKLVFLGLSENDIEYLEDGLFFYNPELAYIGFNSNKIIQIGTQVFCHLNKLVSLHLEKNICINMEADKNQTAVIEIISQTKVKCQTYSDKFIVQSLRYRIDYAQFELLKRLTNLNRSTATKSEIIELKTSNENLQNTLQLIQNGINQLIGPQNTNDDKKYIIKDFSKYILIWICLILCFFSIVLIIIYKRFGM